MLKLQFGTCVIRAGLFWHLSEAHSMDCCISHSCWLQPLSSAAAEVMGRGIIFKTQLLIDRCSSLNSLCLQYQWGVTENIQLTKTDNGNYVSHHRNSKQAAEIFCVQRCLMEVIKKRVSDWCFLKSDKQVALSLHATLAATKLFHPTVPSILYFILLNKKRQRMELSVYDVTSSSDSSDLHFCAWKKDSLFDYQPIYCKISYCQ